ncbi:MULTISPECIES: 8-amino-7-oxononanoate synthase [unclassified Imperialibacter]|uniref:aminotransferase class I/II-fold pyridoxal phosphate-dependent enzyme n=1 Tax=unclassified Imperialibacter TaxID=2629706 RepID=UPI0012527BAA|nr:MULTISPECIES: 8-amino-7-oxononanoate synthase [unclassified Imperialibacter]CAD5252937.1 8-amino-7-oxononanoate synthase [Imperialibacter sp. 75]CAD5281201.1 8-amino-7-oxononanoate synthase [Imperialibacter sp. 89]VVT28976.1 8-amino-7-oxononanoate synthase [Imperialibacter sp. EC-SDR9]
MPPLASTFVMAMKSITPQMQQRLDERKAKGNLRALPGIHLPHDFTSNDYLGLARSTELGQMIARRLGELGAPAHGGTGSRLLSGNSDFAMDLEQKLARIFKGEAALVFNSGYQANLCLISAVAQKGDTILYDQLSHVCLKEGAWLSKAKTFAFLHNDLADLERRLKTVEGNTFVVIESVYSMDGDVAPLKEIAALCKKYEARLIIDEAHGTGVFGECGSGLACALGLEEAFFARVYTFGKAMGVHGAVIVGEQNLIDYLVNFGRAFIYTTAMPLHSLVAIEQAFNYLSKNQHLQAELRQRIALFLRQFPEETDMKRIQSNTAIQPIVVPGNERAKAMAKALQSKGFDVRPILAPTVKEGEERLRICLHTYNTEEEINALCQILSQPL